MLVFMLYHPYGPGAIIHECAIHPSSAAKNTRTRPFCLFLHSVRLD